MLFIVVKNLWILLKCLINLINSYLNIIWNKLTFFPFQQTMQIPFSKYLWLSTPGDCRHCAEGVGGLFVEVIDSALPLHTCPPAMWVTALKLERPTCITWGPPHHLWTWQNTVLCPHLTAKRVILLTNPRRVSDGENSIGCLLCA